MEERSVEDRIADQIFGPEETAEEPAEPVEEVLDESEDEPVEAAAEDDQEEVTEEVEPEYVEMELEGKVWEVPKELEPYIARQQDYTRKTQETALQRKEVEAQQALVQQERDRYDFINSVQDELTQVQQIEAAIPQWQQHLKDNVDNLSAQDITKIQLNIKELETTKQALVGGLQQKHSEFQQAQEQSRKELLDKSTEVLRQKFPDWNAGPVTEYVKSLGFTDDQLTMAQADPRQMELARKAMLYDQLQEGKPAAVARVKNAPSIKAKSRNPMPKETQDKLNLRKKLKNPNKSNAEKAQAIGENIASRMFR